MGRILVCAYDGEDRSYYDLGLEMTWMSEILHILLVLISYNLDLVESIAGYEGVS